LGRCRRARSQIGYAWRDIFGLESYVLFPLIPVTHTRQIYVAWASRKADDFDDLIIRVNAL